MRTVSYSEISTFRQCPLKWYLGYHQGWRAPERRAKLDMGTAWHKVLEVYYGVQLRGASSADAEREARFVIDHILEVLPGAVYETDPVATLHWMLDGYLEVYREVDERYETMYVEMEFRVPTPLRTNGERVAVIGKIDWVGRNRETGRIRVRDYKSASGRDLSAATWAREMALEDQFGIYPKALEMLGYDVEIFEYDGARTDKLKREMTLTERYNRVSIGRSPGELDVLWDEMLGSVREMLATERGQRPVYGSPEPSLCRWKCDFLNVHLMGRTLRGDYDQAARNYGFTDRETRRAEATPAVEALPVEEAF